MRRSRLFLLTLEVLTVMPVRFYYSSFLFFSLVFFWTWNDIYFRSVSCVWVFWHVYKPLFNSSVATCRLTRSKITLLILKRKKAREKSGKWSDIALTSSVPCFVLWCCFLTIRRMHNWYLNRLFNNSAHAIFWMLLWKRQRPVNLK